MYPHGVLKVADINFDGVPDKIGWRDFMDSGYTEFVEFSDGQTSFDFSNDDLSCRTSDYSNCTITFQTDKAFNLKAAAQPGATLFSVGEKVRLLDGRKGEVHGFTFVLDKDYHFEDTRAEVMIEGARTLMDVSLLDMVPQKK